MTSKDLRPQEVKLPRTVKMYHVVYNTLIATALVVGLIGGHILTKNYEGQVKQDAAQLSESITKNIQVKAETSKE